MSHKPKITFHIEVGAGPGSTRLFLCHPKPEEPLYTEQVEITHVVQGFKLEQSANHGFATLALEIPVPATAVSVSGQAELTLQELIENATV